MAILTTGNSYSDGNQITSSNLNAVVNSATFDDPVDTSSGLNLTADSPPKIAINTSLSNKVLTGGSLNNCPIGAVTPSTGAFTTLSSSSGYTGNVTGNLTGNVTGDVTGDVTGNLSGNVTGGTGSFTTLSASGDISVDGTVKQSGNEGNLIIQGGDTAGANIELYGSNYVTESIRNNAYYDAGVHVFRPVDGSSSSVIITSDGEVGIGTESPNAKLQIKTSVSEVEGISVLNAGNTSEIFKVIEDGSNGGYVDIRNSSNTSIIRLNSSGDSYFNADNVGIGTTSPDAKLEVSATGVGLLVRNSDPNQVAGIATVRGQRSDTNTYPASAGGMSLESWNTSGATIVNEHLGSVYFGANHTSGSESNILGTASIAGIAEGTFSNSSTMPSAIAFRTGSAGQAIGVYNQHVGEVERMRIGSDGNVGIGTESPQATLDVNGSATSDIGLQLRSGDTGTDSSQIVFAYNGGSYNSTGYAHSIRTRHNGSAASANAIDFWLWDQGVDTSSTLGSKRVMSIEGRGNVGIGTASPSHRLDVNSGATNQVALFESTDATAYIELADDTGSVQLLTPSSGDFRIYTGGDFAGDLGTSRLTVLASGDVGIGDDTPSFKLDVNGTGRFVGQLTLDDEVLHNISGTQARLPGYYAGTYGVEIEQTAQGSTIHVGRSNGNCMNIGADATAAGTNLNVVYFRDTGAGVGGPPAVSTEVGKIVINTTSTNYSTSSDYRLKENEVVISDGIDRLKQLNAYRFNFIKEPSKIVDGFFAHEVSSIVPESIVGTKDQVDGDGNPVYQGIDQSKLVPLLTAALQEAVAKIEALEARVESLEG